MTIYQNIILLYLLSFVINLFFAVLDSIVSKSLNL